MALVRICICFIALVCSAAECCAEPSQASQRSPKDFFPHNYASQSEGKGFSAVLPKKASVVSKPIVSKGGDHKSHKAESLSKEKPTQTDSTGRVTNDDKPQSIVLVYASSKNQEHFNRVVQAVVRCSSSGTARVAGVLHIGDYTNVTSSHEAELQRAGIAVQAAPMLPKYLAEFDSPVWEVRTGDQVAFLSGVFDVRRFFSKDGRIKRADELDSEIEPIQSMDGF